MHGLGIAVVSALLLGGCGGAFSKHPASEEGAGPSDGRLVGLWSVDDVVEPGAGPAAARERSILGIGKDAGHGCLRAATITLKKDGTLGTCESLLRTTTIGGASYASIRLEEAVPREGPDERMWIVVRYRFADPDTVSVLALSEDAVAADVKAGKIAGVATERRTPEDLLVVNINAATPELRKWLEARGEAIYATNRPFVMRRLAAK